MWVLWNLVSVRLETVLVSEQDMCTVCTKSTIGSKIILDTPDGTPWFKAQSELISVYLEILLILTQDWSTVCTECTKGSEIVLDAPDGIPT
jgi:hypothetical protein